MNLYQTATCSFNYDDVFYTYTLDELVRLTHTELCCKLKWKCSPLKKGSYGYDSMAESIGWLLSNKNVKTIYDGACLVHKGWTHNYNWWTNIKQWLLLPNLYYKPTKTLGNKERNTLANLDYKNLPKKDKYTNIIIARYLLVDLLCILRIENDGFID